MRLPGNTPTSVKNTASFASSRVPKRPCRKRTISAAARPPTMSVKINATAAFAAYSHEREQKQRAQRDHREQRAQDKKFRAGWEVEFLQLNALGLKSKLFQSDTSFQSRSLIALI